MKKRSLVCCTVLAGSLLLSACSSYQPTKNVWKSTKDMWYSYVSVPATVDYSEKGTLSPRGQALSACMMGVDMELSRFERTMLNADRPPTREWMDRFFADYPWVNGFAGVKYDGTLLGQEPGPSLKNLDFIPLLYEDKKQNSRALRGYVQQSDLGPEVMLAAPLYDGVDFLGIVVAYFDMRNLVKFSSSPEDLVILSPQALLWPGKYDFAATPLSSVDWEEVVRKSSSGTCTNERGSFYYQVRYLGNLPLVFAVVESGDFPQGNGDVNQGVRFFPKITEKLPPPPQPERKKRDDAHEVTPVFGASQDTLDGLGGAGDTIPGQQPTDVQPGSPGALLTAPPAGAPAQKSGRVKERQLEGENVQVRRPSRRMHIPDSALEIPDAPAPQPVPQVQMPSPFGPRRTEAPAPSAAPAGTPAETAAPAAETPATPAPAPAATSPAPATPAAAPAAPASPAETPSAAPAAPATTPPAAPAASAPKTDEAAPAETPASSGPALLPGGRPSPFGPRR